MKIVVITGASSGLGAEFARQLDNENLQVDEFWLIARREDRLMDREAELTHKTRLFPMDITSDEFMQVFREALRTHKPEIRVLVNCAGFGIVGAVSDTELTDVVGMLRVNCLALTALTRLCIPYMSRNGRILQLASAAAFLPQPNFSVYAATKAYVLNFSRALGEELRKREVYVTSVCPGPVATEFFDVAEKRGHSYSFKKYFMRPAEKVVAEAILASKHKRTVVTPSLAMKGLRVLTKIVPARIILYVMRSFSKK